MSCTLTEPMSCTKSELVSAINSYAAARLTNDAPLIKMSAEKLQAVVDTLEFDPEPTEEAEQQTDED